MKTIFVIAALLTVATLTLSAQTIRLQQRNTAGQWITLQSQTGKSGTFANIPAGSIRVCAEQDNTSNCVDSDNGKSLTMPQTIEQTVTKTFTIANFSWTLKLVMKGPNVGWNWGKSSATSANNAR